MVLPASTMPNLKATPTLRSQSNPRRPPLLPSEREINVVPPHQRRPKPLEVSSRYLLSSTASSYLSSSLRSPSPVSSRSPATPALNSSMSKRPQSAERRRPSTPLRTTAAAKLLVSSTRSSSVSFQGESFAVANSRQNVNAAPSPNFLSKGTPERGKNSALTTEVATSTTRKKGETGRPIDRQPWPARSRSMAASLSRSMDLGCEGRKLISGSGKFVRALRESLMGEGIRTSSDEKVQRSIGRDETNCVNSSSLGLESRVSDSESVSSECNSESHDSNAGREGGVRGRSTVVPARVWEDANSRLKRASESCSSFAQNISLKGTVPPKLIVPKKFVNDSLGASPRGSISNRGSSPSRRSVRPASPSEPRTPMASERSSTFGGVINNQGSSASRRSVRPASPCEPRTSMAPERSSTFGEGMNNRGSSPARRSVRPASPSEPRTSMPSERSSTLGGGINRGLSPTRSSVRPASPSEPRTSMVSERSSTLGGGINNRGLSPTRRSVRLASPSELRTSLASERSSTLGGGINNRGLSPTRRSVRPASPCEPRTSMASERSSLGGGINYRGSSPTRRSARPASPCEPRTSMASEKSSIFEGDVSKRAFTSPIRGLVRPSLPSKPRTSISFEKSFPFRGIASPSRVRNGTTVAFANSVPTSPSVLCIGADVRRVRVGDNRLGDAHLLRLLHNRHLQWRFVNARTEASLSIQKINAERSLYNAWKKISDLCVGVSYKRKELQWLRQTLKLFCILKDQMIYLEEWALTENDYCSSLSGVTDLLEASVICLPLVSGARADVQDVKDAICCAADVMRAMASSICTLLTKVDEVKKLMAQVASITMKEHSLLNEGKVILSELAALQAKDCSLRAHMLQLKCSPSSLPVTA